MSGTENELLKEASQVTEEYISFSPFTIKKMGIQTAQTVLKLDVYNLICVPYQVNSQRIVLLVSLSRDEIVFFQRFKGALAGLSLTFNAKTNQAAPLKIFARCSIAGIGPMKGRENLAIVQTDFKHCPQDLSDIISGYKATLDKLRAAYGEYRDRMVRVDPDSARLMGYNNYATLSHSGKQYKFALFSVCVNKLDALMSPATPDLEAGSSCQVKLFFQRYQLTSTARVASAQRLPTGVLKVTLDLDFSPELTEILDDLFFKMRIQAKKG